MIRFAEFAPDQPPLESGVTNHVLNVIPITGQSYGPIKTFTAVGTSALTARAQGIGAFAAPDGNTGTFAGDATKLYKWVNSTASWDDVSRTSGGAYACGSTDAWSFAIHNQKVYAQNGTDAMQLFTLGSSTDFAAGAGSPPTGYFLATVRRFLVVGCVASSKNSIRWSAENDPANWTIGVNQADEQVFPSGGNVVGVVGGDYMTVFQEEAINLGTYVGPDDIFQFDKVTTALGCAAPRSIASYQDLIFFWSPVGFYQINLGRNLTAIGDSKVDRFFADNVNPAYLDRISATVDPAQKLYIIGFPSRISVGTPDTVLFYNWGNGRWAKASIEHEFLGRGILSTTTSLTLEDLDAIYGNVDATQPSWDALQYVASRLSILVGFNASHILAQFNGANMAAEIDTIEAEIFPTKRSFIREARPHVDGETATLSITLGTRNRQNDPVMWGDPVTQLSTGECPFRSTARFHRGRVAIAAGGTWTHAQGVDVIAEPDGDR